MVHLDLKTDIGGILAKYPKSYTTLRRLGIPRTC